MSVHRRFAITPAAVAVAATLLVVSPPGAGAQGVGAQYVTGLSFFNYASEGVTGIFHAPGRSNDLFVSVLDGRILRVDLTNDSVSTFATIPDVHTSFGFSGLLGVAFAPDYATSGRLYAHMSDDPDPSAGVNHRTYVREFVFSDPLSGQPTLSSSSDILRIDQPLHDHNGGFLGFQPGDDSTLWIAVGDGGNDGSNPDPVRTGQNNTDLLGSILRVDVTRDDFPLDPTRNYAIPTNNPYADGSGGAPEVWSYGLRSPWGASFDRANGDFYFGDVGQVTREEVNFQRADAVGGANYGWRVNEGDTPSPFPQDPGDPSPDDPSLVSPIYDYVHTGGYGGGNSQPLTGRSITGGVVYRGPIQELQGVYLFGDWSSRQVWGVQVDRNANGGLGAVVPGTTLNFSETFGRSDVYGGAGSFGDGVTAFGEDSEGNVYFAELDGDIYKICAQCGPGLPDPEPLPQGPRGPLEPLSPMVDTFDIARDYQDGTVGASGIWSGVHNGGFGGPFDADITNDGQLSVGMEPLGWGGGGGDEAPFLFREVDAESLMEVRVKISNQTRGNWSSAGILVRLAGPLDDDDSNDQFLSAHSFRVGTDEQPGDNLQTANIVNGSEGETNQSLDHDLEYIRLVHNGNGEFDVYTSQDGDDWVMREQVSNPNLASGMLEVGLWSGSYPGGLEGGEARFDWAEIVLGTPAGDYNEDDVIDAADFTVWRDSLSDTVAAWAGADGDGDGVVTVSDYDIWRQNYGAVSSTAADSSSGGIPEHRSATLVMVALAIGISLSRQPECRTKWRRNLIEPARSM
ncbi:Soluble aldose sugar dehydrogenase YliI precursor [Posidoniimonas corsicana]|uniref:Soluble aldose sugar dehydrogenase YliI n=1 Tax=Posidoniimonas corsicana TaxID=1938618 RepID=A0A5C5VFC2_9BACT|nr:PQQ-dependent sugar dehydrogenase [Posidoniimonas corsicana]TWT36579.1 Soluble aldose sugar dehydrogenase YliI precursor [Posidoniimonas corsicana]